MVTGANDSNDFEPKLSSDELTEATNRARAYVAVAYDEANKAAAKAKALEDLLKKAGLDPSDLDAHPALEQELNRLNDTRDTKWKSACDKLDTWVNEHYKNRDNFRSIRDRVRNDAIAAKTDVPRDEVFQAQLEQKYPELRASGLSGNDNAHASAAMDDGDAGKQVTLAGRDEGTPSANITRIGRTPSGTYKLYTNDTTKLGKQMSAINAEKGLGGGILAIGSDANGDYIQVSAAYYRNLKKSLPEGTLDRLMADDGKQNTAPSAADAHPAGDIAYQAVSSDDVIEESRKKLQDAVDKLKPEVDAAHKELQDAINTKDAAKFQDAKAKYDALQSEIGQVQDLYGNARRLFNDLMAHKNLNPSDKAIGDYLVTTKVNVENLIAANDDMRRGFNNPPDWATTGKGSAYAAGKAMADKHANASPAPGQTADDLKAAQGNQFASTAATLPKTGPGSQSQFGQGYSDGTQAAIADARLTDAQAEHLRELAVQAKQADTQYQAFQKANRRDSMQGVSASDGDGQKEDALKAKMDAADKAVRDYQQSLMEGQSPLRADQINRQAHQIVTQAGAGEKDLMKNAPAPSQPVSPSQADLARGQAARQVGTANVSAPVDGQANPSQEPQRGVVASQAQLDAQSAQAKGSQVGAPRAALAPGASGLPEGTVAAGGADAAVGRSGLAVLGEAAGTAADGAGVVMMLKQLGDDTGATQNLEQVLAKAGPRMGQMDRVSREAAQQHAALRAKETALAKQHAHTPAEQQKLDEQRAQLQRADGVVQALGTIADTQKRLLQQLADEHGRLADAQRLNATVNGMTQPSIGKDAAAVLIPGAAQAQASETEIQKAAADQLAADQAAVDKTRDALKALDATVNAANALAAEKNPQKRATEAEALRQALLAQGPALVASQQVADGRQDVAKQVLSSDNALAVYANAVSLQALGAKGARGPDDGQAQAFAAVVGGWQSQNGKAKPSDLENLYSQFITGWNAAAGGRNIANAEAVKDQAWQQVLGQANSIVATQAQAQVVNIVGKIPGLQPGHLPQGGNAEQRYASALVANAINLEMGGNGLVVDVHGKGADGHSLYDDFMSDAPKHSKAELDADYATIFRQYHDIVTSGMVNVSPQDTTTVNTMLGNANTRAQYEYGADETVALSHSAGGMAGQDIVGTENQGHDIGGAHGSNDGRQHNATHHIRTKSGLVLLEEDSPDGPKYFFVGKDGTPTEVNKDGTPITPSQDWHNRHATTTGSPVAMLDDGGHPSAEKTSLALPDGASMDTAHGLTLALAGVVLTPADARQAHTPNQKDKAPTLAVNS